MFEDFKQQFTKLLTKPIVRKEGGVTLIKAEGGWKVSTQNQTTKLLLSTEKLEKGKAAQIGEVREWNGQKYKKDSGGKWTLVVNTKDPKKEDKSKKEVPTLTDEQLSKYGRTASTEALKKHAEGGDEQMRVAAKAELSRRESEENPEKKENTEPTAKEGQNSSVKVQENEGNTSELTIEDKTETLTSEYKKVVEKLMDPEVHSKPKEIQDLTVKQQEIARYLSRIKEFSGVDQGQAKEQTLKNLGLTTDNELEEFIGDGKVLAVKKSFGMQSFLTEDCYCQRTFDKASKSVHMDEMILDASVEKGRGKGTTIFSNQVSKFKGQGYESLEATAAKSDVYNGYYTWAMLGFEISKKEEQDNFKSLVRNTKDSKIQNCRKLSELVSFKSGAEFWRKNGFQFEGKFDMKENSNSMKLLNNYIENRKLKEAS